LMSRRPSGATVSWVPVPERVPAAEKIGIIQPKPFTLKSFIR
jgi:hypothetical protein